MTEPNQPDGKSLEQSIIDRFLALDPSQQRIQLTSGKEAEPVLHLAETPQGFADPAAAEAEARVLVAAGHRVEAARILLKLSVQMPEKSAYFADLLDNRAPGSEFEF